MAKIGVRKMFYATYTSDGTYTGGAAFGKISSFNFTPTNSVVKDYGDDVVSEVSSEITGGTLSIEANQLTLAERAALLGHTYNETDGLTVKADDAAPYVGVGAIAVEISSGTKAYVGKVYTKLKFHEPNDENATRQENVAFAHTTIEAEVVPQTDYTISVAKSFSAEADAIAFVKGQLDIT